MAAFFASNDAEFDTALADAAAMGSAADTIFRTADTSAFHIVDGDRFGEVAGTAGAPPNLSSVKNSAPGSAGLNTAGAVLDHGTETHVAARERLSNARYLGVE